MNTIYIDFSVISDEEDFYLQLKNKVDLPHDFGQNLDALYDMVTGFLELPLTIEFVNLSVDQLEHFDEYISTLEDAENNTDDFCFSYYLEQYED